jgi:hypothetical protein
MSSPDPMFAIRCQGCDMPIIEANDHLHTAGGRLLCDNCVAKVDSDPVCDFCLRPGPTWTFQAESFRLGHVAIDEFGDTLSLPDFVSSEDWAACDRCREIVEANDPTYLALVLVSEKVAQGQIEPHQEDQAVQDVSAFLAQVFPHLYLPARKVDPT